MESNLIINAEEEKILNELKNIYGTEKCIDVLKNYISFVNLKKDKKINFGNYNILIRNQSEYGSVYQVVEIIWRILKTEKIINTQYRYLERNEIRKNRIVTDSRKTEEIEEELLIIDSQKIDSQIRYLTNDIKEMIQAYPDKVFLIIDKDEIQGLLNANMGDSITWTIEIERISKENKIDYISKFLTNNEIEYSKNQTFIDCLSEQPFWKVKNELINIVFECKAKDINFIDDKIMKETLNRSYYKENKKVVEKGNSLEKLNSMIGMEEVKKQINQIINYIKVNKKRGNMPSLHMCFLGNPGTGKTTVARIVGEIFSKMNILSDKDIFVEAQRNDLIGKYVGQTAPKTKEVIDRANGGVLFIDEAYSISAYIQDEGGRDYGAECIATLIKEMEDKRDSLCVILAGYSKEMQHMLNVNPGFESRVQFKINFPDYTEEELYDIFKEMAKKENYNLSSNLKKVLIEYFTQEKQKENFANARCVRNLFEKIKFEQADRVAQNERENPNLIKKCDIENVINRIEIKETEKFRIGFAS